MPTWTQIYNPTGSEPLSVLLAASPIVVLLGLLALAGWPAHRAALAGLATALAVAVFAYGMPAGMALTAAGVGACYGLFPIGWVVFAAVFLFTLTVETGHFEKVKCSVAGLSPDRRVQAMLIAFCFGAFIEGCAGFGAPVAITSALMIGAGFPPLYAAGLALIANTAPVAFGSLGIPITTLATTTKLDEMQLGMMAGRQLPLFSLILPAWLVVTMAGWRGLRGVWPAALFCGGVFALAQFLMSNFVGPMLVDIVGGLVAILALGAMLRVWQPRDTWRFPGETDTAADAPIAPAYSRRETASAWVPWLLLTLCILAWGQPAVATALNAGPKNKPSWANVLVEAPPLHNRVVRDIPAVPRPEPEPAVFRLNYLSATGTGIFSAALLSAAWLRVPPRRFAAIFFRTLHRMRLPLLTIAAMLAIAYTTRYAGTDVTLGLAFTRTGVLYPFFAAMLGWVGVALTGSDTSSNALFGSLQRFTAERLGLNPILICAANSTGGVMGKMIDAQSIVVASAATQQPGSEGRVLRFVFWHSLALALLMGLLVLAQAYWLTWMVPR
jgi:lactate permease